MTVCIGTNERTVSTFMMDVIKTFQKRNSPRGEGGIMEIKEAAFFLALSFFPSSNRESILSVSRSIYSKKEGRGRERDFSLVG